MNSRSKLLNLNKGNKMNTPKSEINLDPKKDFKKNNKSNSNFQKQKTPIVNPEPKTPSIDEHPYPNDLYKEQLPPEAQMHNNESKNEQIK